MKRQWSTEWITDTLSVDILQNSVTGTRYAREAEFRKTSVALTRSWNEAIRLSYWAKHGFFSWSDAADAWAVAGDAAEDIDHRSRMRQARAHEKHLRLHFLHSETPSDLLHGPLLVWPEVERLGGLGGQFAKLMSNSLYGKMPRREILGFPMTMTQPGETVTVVTEATTTFRADRLVLSLANSAFIVEGLHVDDVSRLMGPVPATLFDETGFAGAINFVGHRFSLTVTNTSKEEQVFSGALMGTVGSFGVADMGTVGSFGVAEDSLRSLG